MDRQRTRRLEALSSTSDTVGKSYQSEKELQLQNKTQQWKKSMSTKDVYFQNTQTLLHALDCLIVLSCHYGCFELQRIKIILRRTPTKNKNSRCISNRPPCCCCSWKNVADFIILSRRRSCCMVWLQRSAQAPSQVVRKADFFTFFSN